MPFYEQYEPYREPIHEREQARLDEAAKKRGSGPIDTSAYLQGNQVVFQDPVLNTYAQIAYNRTTWDLQDFRMNTTAKLDRDYPGIDPTGTFCDVDMGFTQRITRLKGAAALCEGINGEILNEFLYDYEHRQGGIGRLASSIRNTCEHIQTTEHASMVCPDKTVSRVFENAAGRMKKSQNIQTMDKILTAMEQVAGLRGDTLDPQAVRLYNQLRPRVDLYTQLKTGRDVKRNTPETFDVNFQNFENIARQNHYANPNNWGFKANRQIPTEPTDSLELAACMRRYASGTAANALNALFGPTELGSSKNSLGANQATLVIVDGKTVNERMQEIFNNLPSKQTLSFSKWYSDNLEKLSGEIVAAGLMAGKRVEAYVPGPDGKLPEQPTVLHRTGYEPTPLKPVTLNAWERFFNRHGFYKEKAAQAKEYQELLAARERLKANYTPNETARLAPPSLLVKDMFFGDHMRRNKIPSMADFDKETAPGSAFLFSRSGATSACICMMAAMGHNIQDILDPNKLQEERQLVSESYLAHAFTNPTIERLMDPKENLSDPERQQLKDKLVDEIYQYADSQTEAARPKMSEKLSKLSVEQRQDLSAWAAANQKLSDEQYQELQQLKTRARNSAQTPMTEEQKTDLAQLKQLAANEAQTPMTDDQKAKLAQLQTLEPLNDAQKQRLAELSQHQQKWELWQDLQTWQKKMEQYQDTKQQIRLTAQQDVANLMNLFAEAEQDLDDFKFNRIDARIPKYLRHGDPQWLGSVFFHGQQALRNQIDDIMSRTDLRNPDQRKAMLPVLHSAADAMFDGYQDTSRNMDVTHGHLRAAQQTAMHNGQPPLAGNILATEAMQVTNRISYFFKAMNGGDVARGALATPHASPDTSTYVKSLLAEKAVLEMLDSANAERFSDKLRFDIFYKSMDTKIFEDRTVQAVSNRLEARHSNWLEDSKMILSGQFAKEFTVEVPSEVHSPTETNNILQTTPSGNTMAVKVQRQIPMEKAGKVKVSISPELAEKMGFNVQRTNQAAPQNNRGMGGR